MATNRRLFGLLILLIFTLVSCSTPVTQTATPSTRVTATTLFTTTPAVTPTFEATLPPTAIALPRKTDLASVMPSPYESLSWPMATGVYFFIETMYSEGEVYSRLNSSTEDGRITTGIQIWCADKPYPVSLTERDGSGGMAPVKDTPSFGDVSGVYFWYGAIGKYFVRFIQGNCFVELTSQNYNGPEPLYEMASVISERLTQFEDAGDLVFPTDVEPMEELRGERYRELFLHITPFIQLNENSFMAAMDAQVPFLNHVTLGVYDQTSQKFTTKMDLLGYPFLSPSAISVSTRVKAVEGNTYQLWVWVEDELIFVDELLWGGWQGPKP